MRLEHKLPSDRQKPGKQVAELWYILNILLYSSTWVYLSKKANFQKVSAKDNEISA